MGFTESKPSLAVWIVTLGVGESVTKDDFETCSQAVDKSCVPKHSYLKGETAWRYIVGCLLPMMVMRRRHIPRNRWQFFKTKQMEGTGKPYISLTVDSVDEQPAMGFSVAETGAAMAFAHSFGAKHQVTNIGVGIRALTPGVTTQAYVSSHLHELTAREERTIALDVTQDEQATVRRLNIILSVKDAYIKSIGQPIGFDYSRIDCDVPGKTLTVDGESLAGWHIRMFAANLAATPELTTHRAPLHYQVAVAVFRGGHGMKFSFAQSQEDLDQFVTFFDVYDVVKAVPRLGEYDNAGMPPMDKIPLSNKNSMVSMSEKRERREKEKREAPPVPPLPPKYQQLTYASDVKVPVQPSRSSSKDYYPPDIKHPLPSSNSVPSYAPTGIASYTAKGGVPISAPTYTSTKLSQSHTSHPQPSYSQQQHPSSAYGSYQASMSHSQSYQTQNPIHTSRR